MTVEEVLVTLGSVKEWGGESLILNIDGTGSWISSITLKVESGGSISRVTLNTESEDV